MFPLLAVSGRNCKGLIQLLGISEARGVHLNGFCRCAHGHLYSQMHKGFLFRGRLSVARNPVASFHKNDDVLGLQWLFLCSGACSPESTYLDCSLGHFGVFLDEKYDLENNLVVDILSKLGCSRGMLQFRLISFSDDKPVCQRTPHNLQHGLCWC